MWDGLYSVVGAAVSGARAEQLARRIAELDRWGDFARRHMVAELLTSQAAASGLAGVALTALPADGTSRIGDLVAPASAEPRSATLEMLSAAGPAPLADWRRTPFCLFAGSAATGPDGAPVEVEVHIEEADPDASAETRPDLAGKALLTDEADPHRFDALIAAAANRGAVGVIADGGPAGGTEGLWTRRRAFPAGTRGLWGFSLAPETGRRLREHLRRERAAGRPARVRAAADIRDGDGRIDAVTSLLPGTDPDAPEVLLAAPLYLGGGFDNAGAAAALLEAAAALQAAVAEGTLPRPKRTIRFHLGPEGLGLMTYLTGRLGATGSRGLPIAGLGLRGVGLDGRPLTCHASPDATLPAADLVVEHLLARSPGRREAPAALPFSPLDALPADPMFGVGFPVITQGRPPEAGTSADTADRLSPTALAEAATLAAAAAWWLADAAGTEAAWLAQSVYGRYQRRINDLAAATTRALLETLSRAGGAGRPDIRLRQPRLRAGREMTYLAERCREGLGGLAAFTAVKADGPSETAPKRAKGSTRAVKPVGAGPADPARAQLAATDAFRWIVDDLSQRIDDDRIEALDRIRRAVDLEVGRLVLARQAGPAALGVTADLPVPESFQEHLAGQLVPQRVTPGFLSMAGLADADKFRPPGGLLADELLWADGRRSIRDINRMIELSGGKGDLSRLMELYALLATAGHVNYSSRPAPETDREGLLADLRRLGVREGMVLTVHSSLRALGFVIGGAVAVLEALLEAVGENGTLVMPTFNRPTELFVPEFTPATTGLLAEFLRYRSGAVRSVHPALSVAALGPEAGYIVEGHRKATATGEDSPLHRASKKGGYVLLLGVGQDRNSTVHVGESLARSPYRHLPYNPELHRPLRSRLPDGSVAVFEPDELGGCSNNFGVLDERLRDAGRLREGRVGLAPARLMKGDDLITAVKVMLAEDPASLLCRETFCGFCPRARAALAGVR